MKFIVIEGELLKNTAFTPTDKLILTFLHNLNKAGKAYWGDPAYLAGEFGVGNDYIQKRFDFLESKAVIKKNEIGWIINLAWWEILNYGK